VVEQLAPLAAVAVPGVRVQRARNARQRAERVPLLAHGEQQQLGVGAQSDAAVDPRGSAGSRNAAKGAFVQQLLGADAMNVRRSMRWPGIRRDRA